MSETIELEWLENAIVEGNDIPAMPPSIFNMPRGPVLAMDYPGICSIGFLRGGGKSSVAVMVYDSKPIEGWDLGSGAICQLTPEQARNFGASLIELADQMDRRPRQ